MRNRVRAAAAGLLCLLAALAQAQGAYPPKPQGAYPSKAIRFIAPFPPGGSSDVLGRILGQKVSELVGQPVVVENRAGASGNIGHEYAGRQPADGYTLVLSNNAALAINPHLFKRLGFDPHGDFAPVAMVASAGQVLVVHPSVPAASVRELIALAKAKPGALHFGSGGKGIPADIVARLNADFGRIVGMPDVREKYASLGVSTEHSTPQQVTEKIRSDTQEFARILKAAGVEAE